MRTLYDAVSPANIPADAEMVAGYVDGRYAWTDADWARFPNAVKIRIAVFASTSDGHVLDVEPGDAVAAQAPGWIRMRQAAGLARPTIYCDVAHRPEVESACAGLTYDLWIAHYTGVAHLEPGSVATQYADPGPYDLSLVTDGWYPAAKQGDPMTPSEAEAFTRLVFVAGLGREPSPDDLKNYQTAINEGNVGAIVTGVLDSSEGQSWRAKLQSTGSSGAPAPHTHSVSTTTGGVQ